MTSEKNKAILSDRFYIEALLNVNGFRVENIVNDQNTYDNHNSYHNPAHMWSVAERCLNNPLTASFPKNEIICLLLAALYHDAGYDKDKTETENLDTAVFVFGQSSAYYLLDYADNKLIRDLIYATDNRKIGKLGSEEEYKTLKSILKDADVCQTLGKDGEQWRDLLSEEMGVDIDVQSTKEWLSSFEMLTDAGQQIKDDFLNLD